MTQPAAPATAATAAMKEGIDRTLSSILSPDPDVPYVIQAGDTLSDIANKTGTTVEALVEENNIKDKNRIFTGEELSIPSAKSTKTKGDIISSLIEGYEKNKDVVTGTQVADSGEIMTDATVVDPAQKILDKIAVGEGATTSGLNKQAKHGIGTTEYDMVYNYGDTLAPSKPITEMTLKEVFDFQKKLINKTKGKVPGTTKGTSAVGKYQVIKTSLFGNGTPEKPMKNSWADKLNLTADTKYTPEVQEAIGRLALKEAGYDNWLKGNKSTENLFKGISNIWASVEGSKAGQGTFTKRKDLVPFLAEEKPDEFYSLRPPIRPLGKP